LEKVQADTGQFLTVIENLLADLEELLKEFDRGKGSKKPAAAPNAALLDKLLEAGRRYKTTQMEEIIMELEKYEYETEKELVPWLRNQLDNLEYDAIRKRLEKRQPLSGAS
jgi:hypothetical protein